MKPSLAALLDLMELKQAISQHCTAMKSVVVFMQQGNTDAAMARLEGALAALEQTLRGQCSLFKMPCPSCGTDQGLEAWVDAKACSICGAYLDAADEETE